MTEHTQEIVTKSTVALIVAAVTGAVVLCWRRLVRWWKRPSERTMMRGAIEKLSDTLDGLMESVASLTAQIGHNANALHITNANVKLLLDNDHVARWWTDPQGKCVDANKALCRLFRMSKEEITADDGRGWLRRIYAPERPRVLKDFTHAVAEGIPYSCTYPVVFEEDPTLHNMIARGDTIKDITGKIVLVSGTVEPFDHHQKAA